MPGLADELRDKELILLEPLGTHMKTMDDEDIINDISEFEARRQYCHWSVNAATIVYYEYLVKEWETRYGDKHIPRKVFTRQQILDRFVVDLPFEDDE